MAQDALQRRDRPIALAEDRVRLTGRDVGCQFEPCDARELGDPTPLGHVVQGGQGGARLPAQA